MIQEFQQSTRVVTESVGSLSDSDPSASGNSGNASSPHLETLTDSTNSESCGSGMCVALTAEVKMRECWVTFDRGDSDETESFHYARLAALILHTNKLLRSNS
jgi:hypothetical protein